MRHIPRIRACLDNLSRPSSPLFSGPCLRRELWTISRTRNSTQNPPYQPWQTMVGLQRRYYKLRKPGSDYVFDVVAANDVDDLDKAGPDDLVEAAEARVKTELRYPSEIRRMPREHEVEDPDYVAAKTGDELEELGGVAEWWEDPEHWPSNRYVGFGPSDKVTDPALLEVLVRRAVVEGIVLRRDSKRALAKGFFLRGNADVALAAPLSHEEPYLAAQDVREVRRHMQESVAHPRNLSLSTAPEMTAAEARQLASTYDRRWRQIPLDELPLKFCVVTRIQRLTGHIIPDHKLMAITTAESVLRLVKEAPKPKKLADVLEKTDLKAIPNVRVFSRRVTPVDKEQMVGRWKVIVGELEKRELPRVGTGGYERAVEKKWITGRGAWKRISF